MSIHLTRHAEARAKQRSFSEHDIDLIRTFGTEIPDATKEVYLIRERDISMVREQYKRELQRLERLSGCAAILSGDDVVTVFRTTPKSMKKLLRR